MTTVSELKAMLREEIAEPLDYPRVPGLSPEELRKYNEGYRYACDLTLSAEPEWTDEDWLTVNSDCVPQFCVLANSLDPRDRGKHDAYDWILRELRSIERDVVETVTIPRARYNHLLDMEKAVIEFTESITKWEEE